MWNKIKMFMLKITFSPIWIGVLLIVLFFYGLNRAFGFCKDEHPIKDVFDYWRL